MGFTSRTAPPGTAQHLAERCQDDSCPRLPCRMFKLGYESAHGKGYEDGYADGYGAGYSAGYGAGFSAGVALGHPERATAHADRRSHVLIGLAVPALWLLSLWVHPFGRCWRCRGRRIVMRRGRKRPRPVRVCKGVGRPQRTGSARSEPGPALPAPQVRLHLHQPLDAVQLAAFIARQQQPAIEDPGPEPDA